MKISNRICKFDIKNLELEDLRNVIFKDGNL